MKVFKDAVSHNGSRCDVCHVEVDNFDDIPDHKIIKAHAVCFWIGRMLLVNHSQWNVWGIPGGTRESGESVIQALEREVVEEANCRVMESHPVSYQKIVDANGEDHYRVNFVCMVEPIGEFENDPAENINKIIWIKPNEYEKYIEKKEFKKIIIANAIDFIKKQNESTRN